MSMHIKLWPDREIRVEKKRVGRVPVLILRPMQPAAGKPGVLWIHGGGYITGMKEMVYMSRAADLVKKLGVTVVSPARGIAWPGCIPGPRRRTIASLYCNSWIKTGKGSASAPSWWAVKARVAAWLRRCA